MNGILNSVLMSAMLMGALVLAPDARAQSHQFDCATKQGIDRARCERHEKMYAKCGPIKGDAHFACDREFLLANPLDCKAVGFADAKACEAEVASFTTCEPEQGRAFMRCVRDKIGASPMGH